MKWTNICDREPAFNQAYIVKLVTGQRVKAHWLNGRWMLNGEQLAGVVQWREVC